MAVVDEYPAFVTILSRILILPHADDGFVRAIAVDVASRAHGAAEFGLVLIAVRPPVSIRDGAAGTSAPRIETGR